MILYFSGTGNSQYAAQLIGRITGDGVLSLNALMKNDSNTPLRSEHPFVFVCPTYAWRIPRVLEDYILKTPLEGSRRAYFILTCGGEAGNAEKYSRRLCEKKDLLFSGLLGIVMPENYIAMFEVPDKAEANDIIEKAIPRITTAAKLIKNGTPLPKQKISLLDRLRSGIVNDVFYPFFVSAKGFYATGACISCGKCAALCPLNNIDIITKRPQWGNHCTHCMACICSCPTAAIEYKNKSQGKPRYINTAEPPA